MTDNQSDNTDAEQVSQPEAPARTMFSTGMVATICRVAPRTVAKWCDSGQLQCFLVPGSKFRRCPRDAFFKFLRQNLPEALKRESTWERDILRMLLAI
jgi:two-component system response regulator RpaA